MVIFEGKNSGRHFTIAHRAGGERFRARRHPEARFQRRFP